jgi:hypothetical protein
MMTRSTRAIFLAAILILTACHSRERGAITGSVVPPAPGIRISAAQDGVTVASTTVDVGNGAFTLTLNAGTYNVSVTTTSSPFPVSFPAVIVEPGQNRSLGTIELPAAAGHASVSGRIYAGGAASRISLFRDGVERASITTSPSGTYELKELPSGDYVVRAQAEHYADDNRSITVSDSSRSEVNMRMIYRSQLDGVDWERGTLRSRGVGLAPPTAPTPTIRRELAKRAALADAERNLLRIIQMIQVGPAHALNGLMEQGSFTQRLGGFLQEYRVVADRDLEGGRVEIEIELPLTGPGGLSSYLPMN